MKMLRWSIKLIVSKCTVEDVEESAPPLSLKSISGGHTLEVGHSNSTSLGPGPVTRERTKYAPYVLASLHWQRPPVTHLSWYWGSFHVLRRSVRRSRRHDLLQTVRPDPRPVHR